MPSEVSIDGGAQDLGRVVEELKRELQARNQELAEAELQPVLDTIAATAGRLCEAHDAVILLREGNDLRTAAHDGPIKIEFVKLPIARGRVSGRAVLDRKPVHADDLAAENGEFPLGQEKVLKFGYRTTLAIPLLRENVAVGAIAIRRREVRPFSGKQIGLLQTFAEQAVIAINNAGLFEEVINRTKELQESLAHQMATTEVLNVISRSPSEVQPVLDAIVETAHSLCQAEYALVLELGEDGCYHLAASKDRWRHPVKQTWLRRPMIEQNVCM